MPVWDECLGRFSAVTQEHEGGRRCRAGLRNPKALYLKTDKQRARVIREGHPGTGMFPDTRMTDQELTDTLVYLAVLRQQDSKRTRKP